MRIFHPEVRLPVAAYGGTHSPAGPARYQHFRSCLRWDFGFTCAACLLHDRQVGPDGFGQTTAEHFEPRSLRPDLTHDYRNLLYLCRRCNVARRDRPVIDRRGRRLLDPRIDAWSAHFEILNDEITPKGNDADAEYTQEAYDLNDRVKVRIRQQWRERLARWIEELSRLKAQYASCDTAAMKSENTASRTFIAGEVVRLFHAIPEDAPLTCRCAGSIDLAIPPALDKVLLDLTPLV